MLHDREAEPGAAHLPRAPRVDAVESLEQASEVLLLDAAAVVLDAQAHAWNGAFARLGAQGHRGALGAVLHGVVDEVGEHLLERAAIGLHLEALRRLELERDLPLLRALAKHAEEVGRERLEREALGSEPQLARLDAREVEEVLDEALQPCRVALDDAEEALGSLGILGERHLHGLGGREDGGDRRAQLVRDVGDEVATQ